jgi:glyoxylase-like metal-dependent hydrolase (beta-lactamase superfamily II)
MNKPVKRILWVLATITGILVFGTVIFLIDFLHATSTMTPAETGALNDSVWCIKDRFVNAYVFKGKTGYIMIDAGIGKKNFNKELEKLGIKPKKIYAILLTHSDGDHTGSISLFKNAVIYMHHNEVQMIDGTTGKTKYHKKIWKYGPYTTLNTNDTLTIDGLKIKILFTPGHTAGSSSYIIGNDYLLSGDNLVARNGKYEHFPDRFNMNTVQQVESIKTLPDPSTFKYILSGHFGVVKMKSHEILSF